MTQVLTNNTDTSIILTLNNVESSDVPNLVQFAPGESFLYSELAITDIEDQNYNIPLIQDYIDSGVLLNETLTSITQSELRLLSQGNLTINLSNGTAELISKINVPNTDNLQVLPISDSDGKLLCIYYKSIQGISISYDNGATQALISNDNLLFPDEITSFAAQVYESTEGILSPIKKLFIGTLREGVKTFTPGTDLTYVDFEPDAAIHANLLPVNPIFKNFAASDIDITYKDGTSDITIAGIKENQVTTFCPTFILGIINNPINSGCPIFIATRPNTTSNKMKIVFKYLHTKIYQSLAIVDTIVIPDNGGSATLWSNPELFSLDNKWILLQENTTPKSVASIITKPTFQANVLDTIIEYTPTGAIFTTTDHAGNNKLYEITCAKNLNSIPVIIEYINTTLIPGSATVYLPNLPAGVISAKIKNLSYLTETASSRYNIFITTDSSVWRYSSYSNVWTELISFGNTTSYFNTALTDGVLTVGGTDYLKELTNFVLAPKRDSIDEYVGLLATELGLFFYDLKLVGNVFIANAKKARTLLYNIAKSVVSDVKLSTYGQNIHAITCSFTSQIPRSYYTNKNCLQLINDNSELTTKVYYLKPDVESTTDSPNYVNVDFLQTNHVFSAEQLSYEPVLIDSYYNYNTISPDYSFKLKSLETDTNLITALTSFLAYKYYYPSITERVISSINKLEPSILELNDYNHKIKLNFINSVTGMTDLVTTFYTQVSKQTEIRFTAPFDLLNKTSVSVVCIDNLGKVVLPTSITKTPFTAVIDSLDVHLIEVAATFSSLFSGYIFINDYTTGSTYTESKTISGLFSVLTHTLNGYPQVILDSSIIDKLNDIRYIDATRLEISFVEPVDTIVELVYQN